MIRIDAEFDGGNIKVLNADDPLDIRLEIRKDTNSEFFQWFFFRLLGAKNTKCILQIMNAHKASFPQGWNGYDAVASIDRENWFRVPTSYEDGRLKITHTPVRNSIYFAYFAPYSLERHADLIARSQEISGAELIIPGFTALKRPIEVLRFGGLENDKLSFWLIARQHPGESMAEWFMEGFLERFGNMEDGAARALLDKAIIYAVPNMNPDGSALGNLRVNSVGANLNREWESPSRDKSPEVFFIREMMIDSKIQLCLDVHGDEGLPYNFIAGFEGIAEATAQQLAIMNKFRESLAWLNPDFQTEHGYPKIIPGKGMKTTSTGYLASYHGAVSMTLEMPFKDAANAPNARVGWSPGRAKALGRSVIEAMLTIIDDF